jgi:hypothetical protein
MGEDAIELLLGDVRRRFRERPGRVVHDDVEAAERGTTAASNRARPSAPDADIGLQDERDLALERVRAAHVVSKS